MMMIVDYQVDMENHMVWTESLLIILTLMYRYYSSIHTVRVLYSSPCGTYGTVGLVTFTGTGG